MIPTVFTPAFIFFGDHQRVIAAATIGGWSSFAANRTSARAADDRGSGREHVVLKRANLVIARLRTKE
jgi:hypothetical protein